MKDVIDAISARIKAPYFGYAVLAFFALNWKGIFLLIVSTDSPVARVSLFEAETSVWSLVVWPLIVGAFVAFTSPWIAFVFQVLSKKPALLIEMQKLEAAHHVVVKQTELESARSKLIAERENELIERAKRDDGLSAIRNESKREELKKQLSSLRKDRDTLSEELRDVSGGLALQEEKQGSYRRAGQEEFSLKAQDRSRKEIDALQHQMAKYDEAIKLQERALVIIDELKTRHASSKGEL